MKVWDITAPKDNWGKNYAHMEYQRIMWDQLWNPTRWIIVRDERTAPTSNFSLQDVVFSDFKNRPAKMAAMRRDGFDQTDMYNE